MPGPGGTVEQQKIEKLEEIEKLLLEVIDRTLDNPNHHPEYLKAERLLNQVQLYRAELQLEDMRI
jgi:hypothetical protein